MEYRKRRKINLVKVCGDKCCLCGYNKSISALEFHHIDASQKEYGISSSGNCHNLNKDLSEVKKCILVCANCHREIHDGLYSQEFLLEKQVFNEEVALSLKEELAVKKYFCSKCGKEISKDSQSGLCIDCYNQLNRVCIRPEREELKNLIRNMSFTFIGKQYGVSDNAIRKWCISYNLPSKKKDINSFSDKEWEKV